MFLFISKVSSYQVDAGADEDLKLKFVCLTSQKRSTMKTSAVSRDRMPIATESD